MGTEVIEKIGFFNDFTKEELTLLLNICHQKKYSKGSLVFTENTPADIFYFIIKGQIKISQRLEHLGEEELVILDVGECFGEMSLIDEENRSASAIAEVDSELLLINKGDIDLLMEKNKDFAIKLLKQFCRILSARLRYTNKQISEITGLFMSFRTKKI